MEKKEYFDKLDVVKGLAMFLVILGHCIQCGSGRAFNQQELFFDEGIFRTIYSFHMPLFMIISGFLFAKTASGRPFLQTLKGRSLRLLLPIMVWESLIALLSLAQGGGFALGGYLNTVLTGFWFLWAVWWASVVCALVESIGKTPAARIALHTAVLLLCFFTPDELNFSLYKFMYAAFLVGCFAAKHGWDKRFVPQGRKRYGCLALIAAVYIGLLALFRRESYIYISGWTLLGKSNWLAILGWDFYRTLIGVIGSAMVIYAVYLFAPADRLGLLRDFGRCSSGIYILQSFANILMLKYLAGFSHHAWLNVLEALAVSALSYIGVKIVSLVPTASLLLFGQKTKAVRKLHE